MDRSFTHTQQQLMLMPFGIAAAVAGLVMCTSGESPKLETPVRFHPEPVPPRAVAEQTPPTMMDAALAMRTPVVEFTEADVEPIVGMPRRARR